MTKWLPISAAMAIVFAISPVFAHSTEKLDYFVFLVSGKSTQGVSKDDVQKMQAAHIANFERMAKIGELTGAGPCTDPEKTIRGIVVMNALSIADAESKFEPDPYVKEGYMQTQMHHYQTSIGKFVVPADVSKMAQYVIVIFSPGDAWSKTVEQQRSATTTLESFAREQYASGALGFAGIFEGPINHATPRLAVMIFRGDNLADVEKRIGELEMVMDQRLRSQVFPQYLVKDALPSE